MNTSALFETEKMNGINSAEVRDDQENLSDFHIPPPPPNP